MRLTCAIIDDEPLAVSLLESYVLKTPFLDLQGTYNSAWTLFPTYGIGRWICFSGYPDAGVERIGVLPYLERRYPCHLYDASINMPWIVTG